MGGSKVNVKGGATTSGAMEKSRYVRVIEGEEVRKDDPVEYFLPTGVGSTSGVPEGVMAIEIPQNEEISGGERKGVGSVISRRRANRRSVHIKK